MTQPVKQTQKRGFVYLAGPDVFYPDPIGVGHRKKEILRRIGLEGRFPMDNKIDFKGKRLEDVALEIGRANEAMIKDCDIIIANMEPWHGPSMDVGTAYEMGFGRALGKIVVGYSHDRRPFSERVKTFLDKEKASHPEWKGHFRSKDGREYGPDDNLIESFGQMADNLMMVNAIVESGVSFIIPATFEDAATTAKSLWDQKRTK